MLTNEFISLCKEFAAKRENILNESIDDSKNLCKYNIEFFNYILEFRYIKKETLYFKPSSLYCVIAPRKNSVVYYHLTDIIPYLERKTFNCCYFFNIENAERFKKCFKNLEKEIECVTSQLSAFIYDDSSLSERLFENYKMMFSLKDGDIDFNKIENKNNYEHQYFLSMQKLRDGYVYSRFSSFAPYKYLLENNKDKAISKYEKLNQQNKLFDYEKQLLNFIKDNKSEELIILDPDCDTSENSRRFMTFFSIAKAFITVFIVTSLIFCGLSALYIFLISQNTRVLLSAPWYCGFICAALCSVFGSITFFPYMPNKNLTKKQRKELLNILIPKSVKKFSYITFIGSFLVSLFFMVMIITPNIRFYDNQIKFNSKSYNYSEIECVYYIDSRYNINDNRIERASYVILFKDKTSLDLDGYTSVKYTEKHVLPLLKEKNIEIKQANSEKQLPWYTE